MPKRGKKYSEAVKRLEEGKLYGPREALDLIPQLSYAKFDETVDIADRKSVV